MFLYAYRHTYAQRHADAGVPIDVLRELMDHRKLDTTRQYYNVGEKRRREAVDRVAVMQFDRHGNRIWRDAQALLDSEHVRRSVGQVAVPFGICAEPSNVKAGGQACPYRFRCAGCDHFRTDISYLPDLQAHLDDLLRNRERVLAATDREEWARAQALPSEQEITRIRRLISKITSDLDALTDTERDQIDQAVAAVRRHRTTMLGMPSVRPPRYRDPPEGTHRMTTDTTTTITTTADARSTAAMAAGRRADTARRRHRVLKALNDAVSTGEEISVSGIARRAGVDRTFLYRHRDLLEQLHALEAQPPNAPGIGPAVSRASLQADLLAAQERAARQAARVQQLERRLSTALGEQAWRESGLGAPDDTDQLKQQIIILEQHIVDLRLQLEGRDQDLDAARAANRELMTKLNTPASSR